MGGIIQPWLEYVFNLSFIHKNTFSYRLFDNLHTFSCRLFNKPYTFYGRLLGAKLAKKSIYTKLFWNFHKKTSRPLTLSSRLILPKFCDLPAGASSVRTFRSYLRDFTGGEEILAKGYKGYKSFFCFFHVLLRLAHRLDAGWIIPICHNSRRKGEGRNI